MKKIGFILLALVLSTSFTVAQNGKKAAKAEFKKTVHDFGKVAESAESVSTIFTLKNVGDAPLIIQRVMTGCGCTALDYSDAPVLPGKERDIKITYSTVGRQGAFNREIRIFTNVPDSVYTVTIKGEVIRK